MATPFDAALASIWGNKDFTETTLVDNRPCAAIASTIKLAEVPQEAGLDMNVEFFLRLKTADFPAGLPKRGTPLVFRGMAYKVLYTVTSGDGLDFKCYLKGDRP